MSNIENPILFGTERDYTWTAWRIAYGAGDGQGANEDEFKTWWESYAIHISVAPWIAESVRELMLMAWNAGAAAAAAKAPRFDAWWQEILDTQPAIGKTP